MQVYCRYVLYTVSRDFGPLFSRARLHEFEILYEYDLVMLERRKWGATCRIQNKCCVKKIVPHLSMGGWQYWLYLFVVIIFLFPFSHVFATVCVLAAGPKLARWRRRPGTNLRPEIGHMYSIKKRSAPALAKKLVFEVASQHWSKLARQEK